MYVDDNNVIIFWTGGRARIDFYGFFQFFIINQTNLLHQIMTDLAKFEIHDFLDCIKEI